MCQYYHLPELFRLHYFQHAGESFDPFYQFPGVYDPVQVENAGDHVGCPVQVFFIVTVDVKKDVGEVQQMPGKLVLPRLVLSKSSDKLSNCRRRCIKRQV